MDNSSIWMHQEGMFEPTTDFRFRALFGNSPFAIAVFTPDGRMLQVNDAFRTLWGLNDSQLARFNVLNDPQLKELGLASFIQRGVAGEIVGIPPLRFTARAVPTIQGGCPHWIRAFIYPVKDRAGAVHELIMQFDDVTAQEEAYQLLEQRVTKRTQELSTLLDVSQQVASTLDLKTLVGLILDKMKALIDYSGATVFSIQDQEFRILDYRGPIPSATLVGQRYSYAAMPVNCLVIERRAPVIIDDVRDDSQLAHDFQRTAGDQLLTTYSYIRSWMGVPLIVKDHVIGMLTLDSSQPGAYTPHQADLALTVANQASSSMENARLFEQAQTLAVMMERQRLARELHDSVSQALYGIALGARTARALLDRDPQKAIEPLEYVLSLANAGMAEMRALIFELRPDSLQDEGLVAALSKQAEALRARHQIIVRTRLCSEPALTLAMKDALYRIAQESLHNVVKHARAGRVELHLAAPTPDFPFVALDIRDDGVGFDPTATFPGHLGLHSMHERAASLGGALVIESALGQGTHVHARMPLQPSEERAM